MEKELEKAAHEISVELEKAARSRAPPSVRDMTEAFKNRNGMDIRASSMAY
jgi:hypothetical protein